jgi:hypothetical protein
MIDLIPARPWMANELRLQSVQVVNGQLMTPEAIDLAISGGMALAAVEDGKLYGMAGVYERWTDVGLAWALLAEDFPCRRFSIFKLMKRALDLSAYNRVEAYVVQGHDAGMRLLAHLGFEREGTMRKFWQGRDHDLYARVRS